MSDTNDTNNAIYDLSATIVPKQEYLRLLEIEKKYNNVVKYAESLGE